MMNLEEVRIVEEFYLNNRQVLPEENLKKLGDTIMKGYLDFIERYEDANIKKLETNSSDFYYISDIISLYGKPSPLIVLEQDFTEYNERIDNILERTLENYFNDVLLLNSTNMLNVFKQFNRLDEMIVDSFEYLSRDNKERIKEIVNNQKQKIDLI